MFDSDQKSTGTGYTTTVALPIMAFCPVAYHGRYLLSGRLGRLTPSWVRFSFAGHRLQRAMRGPGSIGRSPHDSRSPPSRFRTGKRNE
jgi:hypothetical protein